MMQLVHEEETTWIFFSSLLGTTYIGRCQVMVLVMVEPILRVYMIENPDTYPHPLTVRSEGL